MSYRKGLFRTQLALASVHSGAQPEGTADWRWPGVLGGSLPNCLAQPEGPGSREPVEARRDGGARHASSGCVVG